MPIIAGPNALDFFSLERAPEAALIKKGLGRSAWRIAHNDVELFCKVYERRRGLLQRVASIIAPTARREFDTARRARQREVVAPRALAWGWQKTSPYRTIVVFEMIRAATPLAKLDPDLCNDPFLVDAVAILFARAHNAGLTHLDGHPGNILVRRESDRQWSAWFVDLHAIRQKHRPISDRRAASALSVLEHHYAKTLPDRVRLRFAARYMQQRFDGYTDHRHTDTARLRALVRKIRRESQRVAIRLAWRRDRRLRRPGAYMTRIKLADGWRACVVLKLARRRLFPAPNVPDRTEAQWREWLQGALGVPSAGPHPYSKNGVQARVFPVTRFFDRLRATWFGSPMRRIFEHSHRLRHRDLPAPIILGYAEHRSGGLVDRTALFVPDSTPRDEPSDDESTGGATSTSMETVSP